MDINLVLENPLIMTYAKAYTAGINIVGAKAHRLAFLQSSGFMVPKGIVVTPQAFKENLGGNLDSQLYRDIEGFFVGCRHVIVRSSAADEDNACASYAGQYLSVICLNQANDIQKACEAVWESFSSETVKSYQESMSTSADSSRNMALLIQQLVPANSSGVCFTQDPLQMDKGRLVVINAVHGLGETLMREEDRADQYFYNASTDIISTAETGHQVYWRSVKAPERLCKLPNNLLGKSVLNDRQIREVAELGNSIRKLLGTDQDIEWAYGNDLLYLLQARPITAVCTNEKQSWTVWTRDNAADVIPDTVTPLTWSIVCGPVNSGFWSSLKGLGLPRVRDNYFEIFEGKVYLNQTAYKKIFSIERRPFFLAKTAIKYLLMMLKTPRAINLLIRSTNSIAINGESVLEQLRYELGQCMEVHIRTALLLELGFTVLRLIARRQCLTESNGLIDKLVTGLNEIASTAFSDALIKIADLVRKNEELCTSLQTAPHENVPYLLQQAGEAYSGVWADFMEKYGYVSLKEFELSIERWHEDPSYLGATLKRYLNQKEIIYVENKSYMNMVIRKQAELEIVKSVPRGLRLLTKYYIRHIQDCSIWRESMKQHIVKIMARMRSEILTYACQENVIPESDIFYYKLEELSIKKGTRNVVSAVPEDEILRRKADFERFCASKPWREIRISTKGQMLKVPNMTGHGHELRGLALSSGLYAGRARVVADPSQNINFEKGDVLVAPSTNPAWTPLFILAGAIVTDMGNYLSHGAIIARELGIPAVGNLYDATIRINDGQIVIVDGEKGIVMIETKTE
ncbi:MAG: PEP/pyruvate-binding domain-containing protein [Syntrophotaleaceae bacterium]